MVFKSVAIESGHHYEKPPVVCRTQPPARQEGNLIATVGKTTKGRPSRNRQKENAERIPEINSELLGHNISAGLVLVRYEKNDRGFDRYIQLPFTKGVTERETGRTLLILGSDAHHGESMVGQFEGVMWDENTLREIKKYGNTIRWVNVGNIKEGFVGLDYNPKASQTDGVATSIDDVRFLSRTLMEFGFDPDKRLFLLKPPYIQESEDGYRLRKQGLETLMQYSKKRTGGN